MWNGLEHRLCCTESLQQGAQDGTFAVKGYVLPLEEGSCIYEWIMVDVLAMNIPEERSGRRQDITVCRQRLSIFQDQGNISKRPKSALSRRLLRLLLLHGVQ